MGPRAPSSSSFTTVPYTHPPLNPPSCFQQSSSLSLQAFNRGGLIFYLQFLLKPFSWDIPGGPSG